MKRLHPLRTLPLTILTLLRQKKVGNTPAHILEVVICSVGVGKVAEEEEVEEEEVVEEEEKEKEEETDETELDSREVGSSMFIQSAGY
jgi:hypothetical protein